jgi:hypothetical protein
MFFATLQELDRLQQQKERLQQLQPEQAAAVERLGGALDAVKGDVLAELALERQQLAQVCTAGTDRPHGIYTGLTLTIKFDGAMGYGL